MKRKHRLLLFITSCVPGCGQMHQGYMKRGISLMLSCCILFLLAIYLRLEYLLIFLVPLWLFSFFDSYNLRNQTDEQAAANPDCWPFGISIVDSEKLARLFHRRNSLVGWALVLVGVYILFDTFVGRLMQVVCEYLGQWWIYDLVMRDVPRMVVTIGIIALGLWFIRGPRQSKAEDISAFTPPVTEATLEDTSTSMPPEGKPEQEVPHGEN